MQISIWEKQSFFNYKDVIIAGSGFVGLWTALELKKKDPSLKVCIIEKGLIPTGASTRNAGFSCFGSLTELISDAKKMGIEKMLQLVEMRYRGLKKIRKTFKEKIIDYEEYGGFELFEENGNYNLSSLDSDLNYINKLLKPILKEKVFYNADRKTKKFGFNKIARLVENPFEGQLHPGKLIQALVRSVQKSGVQIFYGLEISGFETDEKQVQVNTREGIQLCTRQLIICTNAFIKQLLPELDVQPARGQILVTSEIRDLKFKGAFHYDEGFYYFRNIGKRILLGGARNKFLTEENTHEFETSLNIQNELERFLKEVILPANNTNIDYRWSGIMGTGSEKMPIIKELTPNIFCAVRMSGMGVALAPIAAEQVAELALQKRKG